VLGEGKIRTTVVVVVVVVVVVARRANLGRMNVTRIDIEATSTSTSNRAHRHRRVASGMVGKDGLLPGGWKETNERTNNGVRAWRGVAQGQHRYETRQQRCGFHDKQTRCMQNESNTKLKWNQGILGKEAFVHPSSSSTSTSSLVLVLVVV